jgi:hypothetical protein
MQRRNKEPKDVSLPKSKILKPYEFIHVPPYITPMILRFYSQTNT